MIVLKLYGTQICALCDEAKTIIYSVLDSTRFILEEIDILKYDIDFDRYRYRIPVVTVPSKSKELNWPFNAEEFSSWLDSMEEYS